MGPTEKNPQDPMTIVVAGASGFVGRRLTAALVANGHRVVAMTRHPESYDGTGDAVFGDVADEHSLTTALQGCQVAYYLVHSLEDSNFRERDASGAADFGRAAAAGGINQIIYLGGLGDDDDDLSDHLASRREVEQQLGVGGVPVTTLRAGVIIGHGGISWEITRQLVDHLPAMVAPRWVDTLAQPIGIDDVIRYLIGVLGLPAALDRALEIGGPDKLTYREILLRLGKLQGRKLLIVGVPLLTPGLSSLWLSLVTTVNAATGRALIDSMTNEVVVKDPAIRELVVFEPQSFEQAARQALDERAESEPGR